jgi:RHS repeat-associated protein
MRLDTVPFRMQPEVLLRYDSSTAGGVLGAGFSITGASAITRCPSNLAQDGEIREVRFDAADKLCLDGKRLVRTGQAPGVIHYRTFPDTFVKVTGYYDAGGGVPAHEADALWFEAFLPSGVATEYGTSAGTKPLARGATRAWLAAKSHDARREAMIAYGYCFAEAEGYTAEYALDEIRYSDVDASGGVEETRAIRFRYGTKDPADIRTSYSGGMALQSSLRLDQVQMVGTGNELVRSYELSYALSPTTSRTLLTQVEECAEGGICKPPTRFQYQSSPAGFKERDTPIPAPVSRRASPMIVDLTSDGLSDLLLPDMDEALSTPGNPITRWLVARNRGSNASPSYFTSTALGYYQDWVTVADPSGPADPAELQPELGTAIDYDQDGRMDIILHDIYGSSPNWQVLLTQPDYSFKLADTGIERPFPLGVSPPPPMLTSAGGSMHLADVGGGDGVPDLIQCEDHGTTVNGDPSKPAWKLHLWQPEEGLAAAGFDPVGEPIDALAGYRCDTEFYTVDIVADGKVNLVVPSMLAGGDGTQVPASTYSALTRLQDGSWEIFDTKLPIVRAGGRVVFLDVTGEGMPDAVVSGFEDGGLRTYINTGRGFATTPVMSLGNSGVGDQDRYFQLAAALDYNNDGRQDLLMPIPATMLKSGTLPAWAVLQAKAGAQDKATFTLVDPQIPFEAEIGEAITLADPHGPRTGDFNGDGAADVILPLGGTFHIFENLAADQDVLVAVSDGMNAHDPEDPDFVPNMRIAYGHMTDGSITDGIAVGDPALESYLYLSHADAANECTYPRKCAVGSRRVVSAYAVNNGADSLRHFSVRYRDGRYHRRDRSFLGFAQRIVTELETGATTADFYDNVTYDEALKTFPFAWQVQRQWRWSPGLPSQPNPDQIELSFTDITRTLVPTNGDATYFTLPTERRFRQAQGIYSPLGNPGLTVEAYVTQLESNGGATILRDTTATASDYDEFGNARVEDVSTVGVDLTLHVERTFKNDTTRWVLGQLQMQKSCSSAAMQSQCRLLARTTTIYGEVETESISSDDNSPDTKLDVTYTRDVYGNVTAFTASDAYGHQRTSTTIYDAEGIFPEKHINAAGHTTLTEFNAGLGVLTKITDPNHLVMTRTYDGFGRLAIETRPDGTQTTVTLARTKDGGPNQDGWRVTQRSTTTGGADNTVEFDSLGRPIRWWWHGPDTGDTPRLMQEVAFDARGEYVARRSVPVSEGTLANELLFDVYEYDAAGREVRHTTPWNAVTQTSYEGLLVRVTDPLGNVTTTQQDPLRRPVAITDGANGITKYSYGPFGALHTVTDPGNAVTRTTRDAFGRVKQLDDPDRGTTLSKYDGFGELLASTDALGRVTTFEYDPLGRRKSRVDKHGAELLTTTWTWDTATNGIGKLHTLDSPDGTKSSTYNALSQLESVSLAIDGESDVLEAGFVYDEFGRVATINYPTPAGAPPFVVTQAYDAHGHTLAVRDSATTLPYWQLTEVDNAGRFRTEMFGNDVTTERSYFPDKQALKSIVTEHGGAMVQNLAYDYDARLSLKSRTDMLQPQNKTERFRYDPLDRLTCAYFSPTENASVPCAYSYDYAPSGNLIVKSDIGGTLSYTDTLHPHAVTTAGSDSFTYDAVGNQITRPGATLTYTPFNLPKTITQGTGTITFDYDGDEQRIRKTTPDEETLYFGDLYERVTEMSSGTTAHRYYVHSPERVVALVTRGGSEPGTRYVHADHLGSIDALTREDGTVKERRSYDPFGQRRNPIWGQPPPMSFSSTTTLGFTGHESDGELGLVNMKGRIYDPKVGRFLTMDPIVSAPLSSGQSWNPYTYVFNNPLSYVDPSGFQAAQQDPYFEEWKNNPDVQRELASQCQDTECNHWSDQDKNPPEKEDEEDKGEKVGAYVPPVDVSPIGNTASYDPQPVTSAPDDSSRAIGAAELSLGFGVGAITGFVPGAAVLEQIGTTVGLANEWLEPRPDLQLGIALGQIVGGLARVVEGGLMIKGGAALSATGGGALVGVPAIVVGAAWATAGSASILAGIHGLTKALSTGSGSGAGKPREKIRGANRADSRQVDDAARQANVTDRRGFGKFIEQEKKAAGRGGSDNFTFDELLELAEEFKSSGGR